MRPVLIGMMTLLLLPAPAQGQSSPDAPRSIIEDVTSKIRKITLAAKSDDEMREQVRFVMEQFVDFDEFGSLCLGKEWGKLTAEQKSRYLAEFRQLLQRTYLKRFKAGRDFTVSFRQDTRYNKTGDRAEVRTGLTSGDVGADVDYRFHRKGEGGKAKWLVYDIIVDEVSIMRNYRKSFLRVLRKDGFDALISRMQSRNEELEDLKKDGGGDDEE